MIFEKAELKLMLEAIQNLNNEKKASPMTYEDREVMQNFMSKLHEERRKLSTMVNCVPCHGVGFINVEADFDGLMADYKCTNCFSTGRVAAEDDLCNKCDGNGVIRDEHGASVDCDNCDYDGPYDSAMMDPESER